MIKQKKIIFVGGGNMAKAIIYGLIGAAIIIVFGLLTYNTR